MVKRKKRRNSKYLGLRSHGRGNIKRGRGAGTRGGVGKAGLCKHRYSSIAAEGYFGKSVKGFVNPVKKPKIEIAHLYDINQRAVLGKLEKKADKFVFEFKGKVLATGKVTVPLSIKALKWSKRVEEKLKASGGEISELR